MVHWSWVLLLDRSTKSWKLYSSATGEFLSSHFPSIISFIVVDIYLIQTDDVKRIRYFFYFSSLLVHFLKNIPCKLEKWIIKFLYTILYLTIINFIIENIYARIYIFDFDKFYLVLKQVINNVRQDSNNCKLHRQKSQSTLNHRITPQIHQTQQNPNFRLNQLQPFPNQTLSLVLIKRSERDIKIPDTYPQNQRRKSQRSTSFSSINQTPHHH